jgi:hypothetical protein
VHSSAERQVASLSPVELAIVASTAIQVQRAKMRRYRRVIGWLIVPILGLLAWGWFHHNDSLKNLSSYLGLPAGLASIWMTIPSRASRAIAKQCRLIEDHNRSAVALALLESWPDPYVNRAMASTSADVAFRADVSETVRCGLNALTHEQISSLTSAHRSGLVWLLKAPMADPDLTISVLRVLESVGGAHELPIVRRVAALRQSNKKREQIVIAAQHSL